MSLSTNDSADRYRRTASYRGGRCGGRRRTNHSSIASCTHAATSYCFTCTWPPRRSVRITLLGDLFGDGSAMKLISDMSPAPEARETYLPNEIIIHIVSLIAAEEDSARRQATLYKCCLISRQWYSVAVPFLYERPLLDTGTTFQKFTATVAPPVGVRGSKMKLGSLVRRLDMSQLVHHSSNSLTARLLGRVKENLEVFIAPMISFS